MRRSVALILTVLTIALSACSYGSRSDSRIGVAEVASSPATAVGTGGAGKYEQDRAQIAVPARRVSAEGEQALRPGDRAPQQGTQVVPLDSAGAAQAFARKVIQNAEITIETDKPNEGQQKLGVIAEKHGGFVIISESKRNEAASQNVASTVVNVVVRVPAQKFQATIYEIRAVGGRILHDKSWSEDVTEEYIDLEARIRTKKALEAQFLEIMKQARKISDAMEVQTQLADVRTEIERLEGRRRFLENQSALSTIKITLHTPTPVVAAATRGFLYDLKAAFGDGTDIGTGIFLGVIRFVIVMIPLTLFILLPAWFVFKWLRKRISWPVKAAAVSVTTPAE
jgi:Domain of unknown function (DUF4349)